MTDQSMLGDPVHGRLDWSGRFGHDRTRSPRISVGCCGAIRSNRRGGKAAPGPGTWHQRRARHHVCSSWRSQALVHLPRMCAWRALLSRRRCVVNGSCEWVSVRQPGGVVHGAARRVRRLVDRNPKFILDQLSVRLEDAGSACNPHRRQPPSSPRRRAFLDFMLGRMSESTRPISAALTPSLTSAEPTSRECHCALCHCSSLAVNCYPGYR